MLARYGWLVVMVLMVLMVLTGVLRAQSIDQAKPNESTQARGGGGPGMPPAGAMVGATPPAEPSEAARAEFQQHINLDEFRRVAVQHRDMVKILDSWARQSIATIRNRQTIDGQDPLYVALDMTFRPTAWFDRNIFYVQAIPIREQLLRFAAGDTDGARHIEAERMLREGLVSYRFLKQPEVSDTLKAMGQDARQSQAVAKVALAVEAFEHLEATLALVPPSTAEDVVNTPWHHPLLLAANLPAEQRSRLAPMLNGNEPRIAGYSEEEARRLVVAYDGLWMGWQLADAGMANSAIAEFVTTLPTLNPAVYPSPAKRTTELWYNRTFNGTLIAFIYFLAMVLFLLVSVGVTKRVEKFALGAFGLALAAHITVMGVRWWLAGRIPIQNEFESVLGSAMSGCIVGFVLEAWKRKGIFGMAFSFVGFLAMTACLAAPYVFGTDLGGSISRVAGILDTYWLYIHVNIVIASYALIFASCIIGVVYLLKRQWHWVNPLEPGFEQGPGGAEGGGGSGGGAVVSAPALAAVEAQRRQSLDTLDQANVVVLQMAFWLLGVGVICGAVWADKSWGRPWGWDPKETFALVTWIVYLVIVHLRFVMTKWRADATAWLSVAGCGVMLFNWIGVNFFLAGLHSYA